jgi:UPF0755 protein
MNRTWKFILILFLISVVTLSIIFASSLMKIIGEKLVEDIGRSSKSLNWVERFYYSLMVILNIQNLTTQTHHGGEEIWIEIYPGEDLVSISEKLKENRLISNPTAFRAYLVYKGFDTQIQAGKFQFSTNLTPIEIASDLLNTHSTTIQFAILAGWRVEEIAQNASVSGLLFSTERFVEHVYQNELEGYLFPGNYSIPRDITVKLFVTQVVNAFDSSVTTNLINGFNQQGFSVKEAVILASIIEREAVVDDEMPLIASVFINRLGNGSALHADPTVQYAVGYNKEQLTWWTNPLTPSDLEIDSPYNTYIFEGLPPGPICNPGIHALQAVAFPENTNYYYFRAACDNSGRHLFARTYQEHLENACP